MRKNTAQCLASAKVHKTQVTMNLLRSHPLMRGLVLGCLLQAPAESIDIKCRVPVLPEMQIIVGLLSLSDCITLVPVLINKSRPPSTLSGTPILVNWEALPLPWDCPVCSHAFEHMASLSSHMHQNAFF